MQILFTLLFRIQKKISPQFLFKIYFSVYFSADPCLSAQQLSRTCFRAHRAVSAIFAHIVQQMPSVEIGLTGQQLQQIGTYFWLQLTECRHRGAFEAATEAFYLVCRRFWEFCSDPANNDDDGFPCNPRQWILNILKALAARDCNLENKHAKKYEMEIAIQKIFE